MHNYQSAQNNMMNVTDNILTINNLVWSGNVPFSALITAWRAKKALLTPLFLIAETDYTGLTVDKADSRKLLLQKGVRIGAALYGLARTNGDSFLERIVDASYSELNALNDTGLIGQMKIYSAKATANAAALVARGISAGDITAFNTDITDFSGWSVAPRTAISQVKSANSSITNILRECVAMLSNDIDKAMYLWAGTSFHDDYFNGRIIINPGTGGGVTHFEGTNSVGSIESIAVDVTEGTMVFEVINNNDLAPEHNGVFSFGFSSTISGAIEGTTTTFAPSMTMAKTATEYGWTSIIKFPVLHFVGPIDVNWEVNVG